MSDSWIQGFIVFRVLDLHLAFYNLFQWAKLARFKASMVPALEAISSL